jgi:hypothetical protein
MNEPTHIKDVMKDVLEKLRGRTIEIEVLTCIGCGRDVPNDKKHNAYYGFQEIIGRWDAICNVCLSHALKICMDKPMIVRNIKGMPVAEKLRCLPFANDAWLIL